jgi:uncharacterized membrane protein YhhN
VVSWAVAIAAAVGVAHIGARHLGASRVAGALKPLPVALVAALACVAAPVDARYRTLVVAGLVLSMAGDVSLLSPRGFRAGLASFLLAHLCYIAAFAGHGAGDAPALVLLVPFVLLGAAILRVLWPGLRQERGPVVAYVVVIVVMGWRAAVRAASPDVPWPSGPLALAGALLFMTSDSLLAFGRFRRTFAAGDAAVMTTYYAAQTLIGLSVLR